MASTFKYHSQVSETVPWSAQYAFPSQAVKIRKQTVKLVPKNGSTFTPDGQNGSKIMRLEFPADNYLNPLNSVLQFDLTMTAPSSSNSGFANQWLSLPRGGAQNVISRLRILYGSLVIEDINDYKTLTRIFSECGVGREYKHTSGSVMEGMFTAGAYPGQIGAPISNANTWNAAATKTYVGAGAWGVPEYQVGTELSNTVSPPATAVSTYGYSLNTESGGYASSTRTRTYCINLMSGLFTQRKLIPLKWMASQLAIEITLSEAADTIIYYATSGAANLLTNITNPTYSLTNVNFIGEMIEFDSTYDAAFMMGLSKTGVPLKFSSFHWHSFTLNGASQTLQIHERARSVKSIFAVVRDSGATKNFFQDGDNFYFDVNLTPVANSTTATDTTIPFTLTQTTASATLPLVSYQFRVGGQYYPSQPVRCDGGAAEAYVELMKAINYLGDYTTMTDINYKTWTTFANQYNSSTNVYPSTNFIIAIDLENTSITADMISGINAEEQNDIALNLMYKGSGNASVANKFVTVFCHYDSLLIIRDNNTVDLVF